MQIVSLILAFSLLMIVFSTLVSGLVEVLLRLFGSRVKNLRNAVHIFCKEIVWPRYAEILGATADDAPGIEALIDALTLNPVAVSQDKAATQEKPTFLDQLLGRATRGWLDALSIEAFVQRLAKTDVGMAFKYQGDAFVTAQIQDFSLTFERYMAASAENFRKHAHYVTFVV